MAIPDVGAALAAPAPQPAVSSGSKGKPAAQAGRSSFASIVSDLSEATPRPASDGAPRAGGRTPSGPQSPQRTAQSGRVESASKAVSSKPSKGASPVRNGKDLNAPADDVQASLSAGVESGATAPTSRRTDERGGGPDDTPDVDAAGETAQTVDPAATSPTPLTTRSASDVPADTSDANATGNDDGKRIAVEAEPPTGAVAVAQAFVRPPVLRADALGENAVGRTATQGGAPHAIADAPVSTETFQFNAADAGDVPARSGMEVADVAAPVAVRGTDAYFATPVGSQPASSDAVLTARTSIRDALARSVTASPSQLNEPRPDATSGESADAPASARTVAPTDEAAALLQPEAEPSSPPPGNASETGARRSAAADTPRAVTPSPALPKSEPATAPAEQAEGRRTVDAVSDRVLSVPSAAPETSASASPVAVSSAVREPAPAAETPEAPGVLVVPERPKQGSVQPLHTEDTDVAAGKAVAPEPAALPLRGPLAADRMPAPLAALRAQEGYARASAAASAPPSNVAPDNGLTVVVPDASSTRPAETGAPIVAVPTNPVPVPAPPRGLTPRAVEPRQVRAAANAGSDALATGALAATLATGAVSSSAVVPGAGAESTGDQSSQDAPADPSTPTRQTTQQSGRAVSDPQAFFDASLRQSADATSTAVTGRVAQRGGRDTATSSPAPVAPRLTGTSAIAIAAFQAAAAAASTAPELASSAQLASPRVLDLELPSQIVQAIRLRADNGNGQVHMRLNPDYLGDVSVDVRMNGSTVVASVHASSAEVRDWLRTNEMQLRQTLADQGLHLQELVVADEEPAERERSGQRHQSSDEQPQQRRPRQSRDTATFEVLL